MVAADLVQLMKIPHFVPFRGPSFGMTMVFLKKGGSSGVSQGYFVLNDVFSAKRRLFPESPNVVIVISSEARNLMLLVG